MSNAVLEWIQQILYLFIYFGPASMYPQHAHSWVVEFQPHNRGHMDTRICPSSVLDTQVYIPNLKLLPVVSYLAVSYLLLPSPTPRPLLLLPVTSHPLGQYHPVTTISEQPMPRPPHRPLSEVHNWPRNNVSCNRVLTI